MLHMYSYVFRFLVTVDVSMFIAIVVIVVVVVVVAVTNCICYLLTSQITTPQYLLHIAVGWQLFVSIIWCVIVEDCLRNETSN